MSRVYVNLDEDARIEYDEVKKALFQHYQVTLATYRLKLDNLKRKSGEAWATMTSRGKNLSKKWLAECYNVDQAADLLAMDSAVKTMPKQLLTFIRVRNPRTTKEVAELADNFMAVREWNYDYLPDPDRTGDKSSRKDRLKQAYEHDGRYRPSSPKADRRDRGVVQQYRDQCSKLPKTAARADLDLTRNSQAVSGDRSPNLMRKGDLGVSSVMPMAILQLNIMPSQQDRRPKQK